MLNVYVPGPLHVIRRRKTTPYFHRVIVSKSVVPNAWAPPPVQQAPMIVYNVIGRHGSCCRPTTFEGGTENKVLPYHILVKNLKHIDDLVWLI